MTIIATASVPVINRLDLATTFTSLVVPACPAWCTDGPHKAVVDELNPDDVTTLHTGAEPNHLVGHDAFGELSRMRVVIAPEWLEGSAEPAHVNVNIAGQGKTYADLDLMLTPEQAEAIALDLLAAARSLLNGAAQ